MDSESIGDAEVSLQNDLIKGHMRSLQKKFSRHRVRFVSLIEGNMSCTFPRGAGLG